MPMGTKDEIYSAVGGPAADRRSGRLRFRDADEHASSNAGSFADGHVHTDGNPRVRRYRSGHTHAHAGAYGSAG